eukprot:13271289-Ditylum_brightwellii.AAC.1
MEIKSRRVKWREGRMSFQYHSHYDPSDVGRRCYCHHYDANLPMPIMVYEAKDSMYVVIVTFFFFNIIIVIVLEL